MFLGRSEQVHAHADENDVTLLGERMNDLLFLWFIVVACHSAFDSISGNSRSAGERPAGRIMARIQLAWPGARGDPFWRLGLHEGLQGDGSGRTARVAPC